MSKVSILVASLVVAGFASAAETGLPDPIFTDGFEDEAPLNALCVPDGVQYPPAGYTQAYSPTLEQLWLETTGQEIGGASAKVRFEGGTYTSMRFDRAMFNSGAEIYTFNIDTSNVGVGLEGADYRYITISECEGDLREPDNNSEFEVMRMGCRTLVGTEGPFLYLNWGESIANPNFCNLDPAKTYYFSVIFDRPSDGYDPTALCSSSGSNHCGFRMAVQ